MPNLLPPEDDMVRTTLLIAMTLSLSICAACDGETADLGGVASASRAGEASDGGAGSNASAAAAAAADATTKSPETPDTGTETCALNPDPTLLPSGSTLARPVGPNMRLSLVYQGKRIAIMSAKGGDYSTDPSSEPLQPGKNAGYWFELRDKNETVLYTQLILDPTRMEAHGPNGQLLIPECDEKLIAPLDLPNDLSAKAIVFFGSPYGTFDGASEIGRFVLP